VRARHFLIESIKISALIFAFLFLSPALTLADRFKVTRVMVS
jgi:hypothetical protein